MKIFHILHGYALIGILAASVSWVAHAADYAGQAVLAFIDAAFPSTPPPELAYAVAAAPRVTGLHQTRSFHQRLIEHSGDGRRRAPLSSAFTASA